MNHLGDTRYDPKALEGRVLGSPQEFIDRLRPTQSVPCPWGDFGNLTASDVRELFVLGGRMDFPLALDLGCGSSIGSVQLNCCIEIGQAGITLASDFPPPLEGMPHQFPPDTYVQIDLKNPNQINLGGLRCHYVEAANVFTEEARATESTDLGATASVRTTLAAVTAVVSKILMPHGLFVIDPADPLPDDLSSFARRHNLNAFNLGLFRGQRVLLQKRGE